MLDTLPGRPALTIEIRGDEPSQLFLMHVSDSGETSKPVLLLLHGYTDSGFSFSQVAAKLSGDWRVIIPDQRGHGNSERPTGSYAPAQMARDAFAVLDALRVEAATVVGHSMGSFVAQWMAVQQPHRVEGLVLIGSAVDPRNDITEGLLHEIKAMGGSIPEDFVREFQTSSSAPSVPEAFLERAIQESSRLPKQLWMQVLRELIASGPVREMERTGIPVFVIGGDADGVFSADEQRALARAIPRAQLHLESGVGHSLHWEKPELFVELMNEVRRSRQRYSEQNPGR